MPLSFWFFLGVCIISFVPVIKDHGESWREYKSSSGKARRNLGIQLFALWAIPVFTAMGTAITGIESVVSGRENAELHRQAGAAIQQAAEANKLAAESNERSKQLESTNMHLRIELAEVEKQLLETRAEWEESQLPMNIGPGSGLFGAPKISRALKTITNVHITLMHAEDPNAKATAEELALAFALAGWKVEKSDKTISTSGIFIGSTAWGAFHVWNSMKAAGMDLRKIQNWRADLNNEKAGLLLLKLLTEAGVPAQADGSHNNFRNPILGIPFPTNSLLVVVGTRPSQLVAKAMLLRAESTILNFERDTVKSGATLGTDGRFDDNTATNLFRIDKRLWEISEETYNLGNKWANSRREQFLRSPAGKQLKSWPQSSTNALPNLSE